MKNNKSSGLMYASKVVGRDICSTDELTNKDYYKLLLDLLKDRLDEVIVI